MDIQTLKAQLNKAIKKDTLDLMKVPDGIQWDLPWALKTFLKQKSFSLKVDGEIEDAISGAIVVKKEKVAAIMLSGTLQGSDPILNIARDKYATIRLFASPKKPDSKTDKNIDYTLILEFNHAMGAAAAYRPADSFPALAPSTVFSAVWAVKNPSLILSSFNHHQNWGYTKGANPTHTFPHLEKGLSLQLPSGISTTLLPILGDLFGDITALEIPFNGSIDNSKLSDKTPEDLTISLAADMGSVLTQNFSGNSDFPVEFDLGLKAFPTTTEDDPEEEEDDEKGEEKEKKAGDDKKETPKPKHLVYNMLVIARIKNKLIVQTGVPLTGNVYRFSMEGVDGHPAISIADIGELFSIDFLKGAIPSKFNESGDFFKNLGVYNVGLNVKVPQKKEAPSKKSKALFATKKEDSKPKIIQTLLKVGYTGKGIGYDPWFSLDKFMVTWQVTNPFSDDPDPLVMLSGDLELMKVEEKNKEEEKGAIIDFEATFSKKTVEKPKEEGGDGEEEEGKKSKKLSVQQKDKEPEEQKKKWVFEIHGGLKDTSVDENGNKIIPKPPKNVIHLTEVLTRYSSTSEDINLPDTTIDKCYFLAKPEESTYEFNFEIDADWTFSNFIFPQFKKVALDIASKKNKQGEKEITGTFATVFGIKKEGSAKSIDFEISAKRTAKAWNFGGTTKGKFSIGEFANAMGLDKHPAYLDGLDLEEISVNYSAPIDKEDKDKGDKDKKEAPAKKDDVPKQERKFDIKIQANFPVANTALDVKLGFTKTKKKWDLNGTLVLQPKEKDGVKPPGIEFDFTASHASADVKPIKEGEDQPKVEKDSSNTKLIAKLKTPKGNAKQSLNISDFAGALGLEAPPIPDALNEIELKEAHFEYQTAKDKKSVLLAADSDKFGKIIFLATKVSGEATDTDGETTGEKTDNDPSWKVFFGLAFKPTLDFAKLPVVGDFIHKVGALAINNISIIGLPKPLTAEELKAMNAVLKESDNSSYPQLPEPAKGEKELPAEAIFSAEVHIAIGTTPDKPIPLKFVVGGKSKSDKEPTVSESGQTKKEVAETEGSGKKDGLPENGTGKKIGKSFGPVNIEKFNISYSEGKIGVDINGALTLAGITMSFQGLGAKMSLPSKEKPIELSFQLHGLGVNVQKSGFQLTGGFITMDDNYNNFMGMVAITAGQVGFQAFGGYATTTPSPSVFIFLHLKMPIGGPPFFFVDGISGGFGINRDFILPTFDELDTFPLLPQADNNPIPTDKPANLNAVTEVLTSLAKYIPPKDGAYWIAVGLDFTSFKIVQVSAILEVSFGASFQIGLLGNASISIPVPEEPIAFISINFLVEFIPAKGILGVLGKITPASYVFSKACKLTGGFAFFIWFENSPYEGDFVITIGGYHPAFKRPDHYPAVPRMSLKWDLGPLQIQGQSYFALTPHMLMAGLSVSATFEAGPVKAWFDLGIDFLLGWKPFFYMAHAYIHIGAELDLIFTIRVHIGADLYIWGPEFGGKAIVDLDIFKFTIHFGSKGPTPPPIPWAEFKKMLPNSHPGTTSEKPEPMNAAPMLAQAALLGAPTPPEAPAKKEFSVGTVNISKGMREQLTKDPIPQSQFSDSKKYNWIIDPNHFEILITAGVPSGDFTFNEIDTSSTTCSAKYKPGEGHGAYLLPGNEQEFFTNQDAPNTNTLFSYDYEKAYPEGKRWWEQPIGVGPVGMSSKDFDSILHINVCKVEDTGSTSPWGDFIIEIISKNAAKSLWGEQVTAENGSENLNEEPTVQYTLGGFILRPKIWNPLQTLPVNVYLLLYNQGNNLCWPKREKPTIGPNIFKRAISEDSNTMTFKAPGGQSVNNEFRVLKSDAFAKVQTGKQIINEVVDAYGLEDLTVETNGQEMAKVMYKDWPILALLGEEDEEASNFTN